MPRLFLKLSMFFLFGLALMGCDSSDFKYQNDDGIKTLTAIKPAYPNTRFVVISDPHYHDPSLGTKGSAFQEYLERDRKLLAESSEILSEAVKQISAIEADFVIVCGDMTKDGERVNHQAVASQLKKVVAAGKKVFVVPGNHDVANGESFRYQGDEVLAVANVSAVEFKNIYHPYGFKNALMNDSASLSYVAEPVPGLWLLALDSCLWRENKEHDEPETEGKFSIETLGWMEDVLIASKKQNKAVMVVMHHGIWEHYKGNEKYYAKYLVDDFEKVARMLAAYGVALVFTGHFHAQDITLARFDNPDSFLLDIETGSLVTYPCPYRVITVSGGHTARVESRFIASIPSFPNFRQHAQNFCLEKSVLLVNAALKKYRMSQADIDRVNTKVAEALMTHLAGDETKPASPATAEGMGLWGKFIFSMRKDLIDAWHSDLLPADNQITIDLKTGKTL
ncbi:MAG: metallophosphoesterase [Deltaproteobacteria bacterium]|nr:metallophosphoesterase [Deltaproteobacteria bacterium]